MNNETNTERENFEETKMDLANNEEECFHLTAQ